MQAPGTWLHNRLTLDFRHGRPWDGNIKLARHLRRAFLFLIWPTPGRQCAGGRSTYMRQMSQEYMLVSFHHWMERWGMSDVSNTPRSWPHVNWSVDLGWRSLAQWLDGPTRGLRILTIHETSFYGWRSLKSQCSETVLTAIWSTPRKIDMIHLKITQLEFGESSEPNFVISSR